MTLETPFHHPRNDRMVYSGIDRHSFGFSKPPALPPTPRDRGPWSWDRTGTAEDVEPVVERKFRVKSARTKQEVIGQSYTEAFRNNILAMPTGSVFRGCSVVSAIAGSVKDQHRTAQWALRSLVAKGAIDRVRHGVWVRL